MKTIYLVRHGQTFFNLHHKVQGRVDSPLTELGMRQAQKAAAWFKENKIEFDMAFCSTQERASDTLEIVTDNKMDYSRMKDLREKNYGMYEGQDQYTLPWHYGESRNFVASMEPDSDVVKRMERAMSTILKKAIHAKTILIVGHGDILAQYIRRHDAGRDFTSLGNCEIAKLVENDGKVELVETVWPARNLE
ncbi:histidine phosphatase family protein [Lactobacillus hominis]|uniref:histidine phosphatase family protein n=1 Tax=Lactobacillus hominis TaxID=1203033 RepID=UPI0023F494AB|nr:histidine phosphatase family protein [Lactobacillus hominis]